MSTPKNFVGEIRCHIGGLLNRRLASLGASKKQPGADHQHRQGNGPRESQERICDTCTHRHGLHRVSAGSSGNVFD
jgi:hypothetical protein